MCKCNKKFPLKLHSTHRAETSSANSLYVGDEHTQWGSVAQTLRKASTTASLLSAPALFRTRQESMRQESTRTNNQGGNFFACPTNEQQRAPCNKNKLELPNHIKLGIKELSGLSMDDVKVHYKSHKPAQLGALAYAQNNNIYLADNQEKHLPHEAWHIVQQKQGRVTATLRTHDVNINDDMALEREADIMGVRVAQSGVALTGGNHHRADLVNPERSLPANKFSPQRHISAASRNQTMNSTPTVQLMNNISGGLKFFKSADPVETRTTTQVNKINPIKKLSSQKNDCLDLVNEYENLIAAFGLEAVQVMVLLDFDFCDRLGECIIRGSYDDQALKHRLQSRAQLDKIKANKELRDYNNMGFFRFLLDKPNNPHKQRAQTQSTSSFLNSARRLREQLCRY